VVPRAPAYTIAVTDINDLNGDADSVADPGENVGISLRIENHGGSITPDLVAVLQDGPYFDVDEMPHLLGSIPIGPGVDVRGCRVQIAPDCPVVYSDQLTLTLSGSGSYQVAAGTQIWVGPWSDDAEIDRAWTLGLTGDTATSGRWERSDPVGTTYGTPPQQVQPEDDCTAPPAHICFVTGNGTVGGAAGANDVDGGMTTLLSPAFNVEGATSATLTYWRWYTNNLGNSPSQDY
jgi:hypothetical protein